MNGLAGAARTLSALGLPFLCAGLFAIAELTLAIPIGGFFDWGRAEALLFLAVRPLLLLILAFSLSWLPWKSRYPAFALCLVTAGISQSLFLLQMGAGDPWPEMVRGWIGGILVVCLADILVQAGRRLAGRRGAIASALLAILILLLPGSLGVYERIIMGSGKAQAGPLPEVAVMTSLPIVWGEAGPFDPSSRPSLSWTALQQDFRLRPIDTLRPADLGDSRLLLLAQPRQLSPAELVTVDHWVRSGGRALILADPRLVWPSALPPGDARRPFATNMLAPLLAHWGIGLGPSRSETFLYRLQSGGASRQLLIRGSADLTDKGNQCRSDAPFILECRIAKGRAIVIADADLLHDSTNAPQGSSKLERHNRVSDNAVLVADLLDRLAGMNRERSPVQWARPGANAFQAVLEALLPIAVCLVLAAALILLGRRHAQIYPQPLPRRSSPLSGKNKPRKGSRIL